MPIIVKPTQYELATAGLHTAELTTIRDLGVTKTKFGDRDVVEMIWTILDQKSKTGNKPITVHERLSKSLSQKSTLYTRLTQMGVQLPPDDRGIDLEKLIRQKAKIVVTHNHSNGKAFANIATVVADNPEPASDPEGEESESVDSGVFDA